MDFQVIDGGWRVSETSTHFIEVYRMLYNYRVVLTPKSAPLSGHDHGWCYFGCESGDFIRAMLAARIMGEQDLEEPPGYDKKAF